MGEENAELDALIRFYEETGGAGWREKAGWGRRGARRGAYGVVNDRGGRVAWLELGDNGVSGTIPDFLGRLTNLRRLSLPSNNLRAAIPATLGNLANLRELNLSSNELSGPIPSSLGGLENVITLSLSGNKLSGAIPSELGNLRNLSVLSLGDNALSGRIPEELGSLTNLTWLSLSDNALSGGIPASLGNLTGLTALFLHGNVLSGPVPAELGNLARLGALSLDDDTGLCLTRELAGAPFGRLARADGVAVCGAPTVSFGKATYVAPVGGAAELALLLSRGVDREVTVQLVGDPGGGLTDAGYRLEAASPARITANATRPWLLDLTVPANTRRATLTVDVVDGVDVSGGASLYVGIVEEWLSADLNVGERSFTEVAVVRERSAGVAGGPSGVR